MLGGGVRALCLGSIVMLILASQPSNAALTSTTSAVFLCFRTTCLPRSMHRLHAAGRPPQQVRNAMDRARMNSAIRVFNTAVIAEGDGGMVSEKVRWPSVDIVA